MSLSPVPTARTVSVTALVLVLAACTSDPGASQTTEATASPSATEAEATASPSASASEDAGGSEGATVLVAESDLGQILTDADGLTIYYFANDTEGVSNCEGDCLANWPPVEAEGSPAGDDGVTAELGTIERSDGTSQLTINGFPAYYFAADEAAGDTNGQGVGDVWWVFGADGEPIEG